MSVVSTDAMAALIANLVALAAAPVAGRDRAGDRMEPS